jgi:hypothetical protein
LSAGALALSITFLEKIVPIGQAISRWVLSASWIAFGVSILIILFSFLTSQWACSRQLELLDEGWFSAARRETDRKRNGWTKATTYLNIGSILFLALGIFFFCYFTVVNLPEEVSMSDKRKDYGYTPPQAPVKTIEKGLTPPSAPTKPKKIEEGYTPPQRPIAPPAPPPAAPPSPQEKK